jgi:hypothetical protein
MLCLSYYCLYSLFNKIRDKGRTVSAWKQGGRGVEGGTWGRGKGQRMGAEMAQTLYTHMNKWKKIKGYYRHSHTQKIKLKNLKRYVLFKNNKCKTYKEQFIQLKKLQSLFLPSQSKILPWNHQRTTTLLSLKEINNCP